MSKLKQKLQHHHHHHHHSYMRSVLLYWLINASVKPNACASLRLVIGTEEATSVVHISEFPQSTYSPRTCLEETSFSSAVSPQDWHFLWWKRGKLNIFHHITSMWWFMWVRCMLALTAHFEGIYRCLDRAFQIQVVLMTWSMVFIQLQVPKS